MSNKTVLKENLKKGSTKENKIDMATDKKQKMPPKKSSALLAASMGRSAVGAVKANSSRDVRGSSGLANTGTIISYD